MVRMALLREALVSGLLARLGNEDNKSIAHSAPPERQTACHTADIDIGSSL
jgi:hypothetical protein